MTLKQLKENKFLRFISNRYVLIFIGFAVWMFFFDENSFFVDRKFNKTIEKLENDKEYYLKEIEKDSKKIKDLENPEKLDKFAREEYNMKKEDEDIFIIEYDTIKKK
ncbi:MAG: septum formation initiator [Bacteroidetes bacterium MedPE-SWsnd-G1]|uniref:Septum formation initiator family protein n=1 Tax=Urechidicola vernalis TaxID=3075600 RepID=A0ABU2Y3P5_9FLAO|nr:septum formation initiator family protein [Urechidicola sp. P050]MDT0552785.1 septum formation initiator family protein [Urechidicola sp. P050]OIQ36802.1 MAG: septum formation initiator [Bacteroidetes bacterium MedPE-SWsnd-G1]